MYAYFIWFALLVLLLGIILALIRLFRGPTVYDRVAAFDCVIFSMVGIVLLDSILSRSADYLDILLVLSLLGFVATLVISAYLEGTLLD